MAYRTSLPLHPTEDGGDRKKKKKKGKQYKAKGGGYTRKKKKRDIDYGKAGAALFLGLLGGTITATTYKGGHDSRKK